MAMRDPVTRRKQSRWAAMSDKEKKEWKKRNEKLKEPPPREGLSYRAAGKVTDALDKAEGMFHKMLKPSNKQSPDKPPYLGGNTPATLEDLRGASRKGESSPGNQIQYKERTGPPVPGNANPKHSGKKSIPKEVKSRKESVASFIKRRNKKQFGSTKSHQGKR